ncbi:hypothetical protein BOTBODRAFT_351537 [Botryobasidium botryosum FD-172 SS1]|uniref:Uncharacterized protein n=1 Tax=Botryobasidium botryosum (strain FD-172 SS1) TaxID=930990 RepID=A0A067MHC9_BOTB1|nr:hypothetical protein BOTBODRAFT_351537 [Botryobasidium botryosum FD-172 SS1]
MTLPPAQPNGTQWRGHIPFAVSETVQSMRWLFALVRRPLSPPPLGWHKQTRCGTGRQVGVLRPSCSRFSFRGSLARGRSRSQIASLAIGSSGRCPFLVLCIARRCSATFPPYRVASHHTLSISSSPPVLSTLVFPDGVAPAVVVVQYPGDSSRTVPVVLAAKEDCWVRKR